MTGRLILFWLALVGSVALLGCLFLSRSREETVARQVERMGVRRKSNISAGEEKGSFCFDCLPGAFHLSRPLFILIPAFIFLALTRSCWSLLVSLPFGLALPGITEKLRDSRKKRLIRSQLYDFLDAMIQSLEGGFSIYQALEFSADDVTPPLSLELQRAVSDINYGSEFEDAMERARKRVADPVFDTMVDTLLLLKQSGGNLPLLLRKLRGFMRDREEAEREIRVNTTQGRWSGYVVASLPLAFLAIESIFSPSLIRPLFSTPVGLTLLAIGLGLDAAGFLCVRHISKLGRAT